MRHIRLINGQFIDQDGATVESIDGCISAVAAGRERLTFLFNDNSVALHLDRDMRPASRLLLLVAGSIQYNLPTASLHIWSEPGDRAGQSRLRLLADGDMIPAPHTLPNKGERRERNAALYDSICLALGQAADIMDGDGDDDGLCLIGGEEGEGIPEGFHPEDFGPVRLRSVRIAPAQGEPQESEPQDEAPAEDGTQDGTTVTFDAPVVLQSNLRKISREVEAINRAKTALSKALNDYIRGRVGCGIELGVPGYIGEAVKATAEGVLRTSDDACPTVDEMMDIAACVRAMCDAATERIISEDNDEEC